MPRAQAYKACKLERFEARYVAGYGAEAHKIVGAAAVKGMPEEVQQDGLPAHASPGYSSMRPRTLMFSACRATHAESPWPPLHACRLPQVGYARVVKGIYGAASAPAALHGPEDGGDVG